MEDKDFFQMMNEDINQTAQKMKDRFIDDLLIKFQQFSQDWQALQNKRTAIEQKKQEEDKLNK